MYFFQARTFERLREIGLEVAECDYGTYTHRGQRGYVVNTNAFTLQTLQTYASRLAFDLSGSPAATGRFRLETDNLGVQTVIFDVQHNTVAAESDDGPPLDSDPSLDSEQPADPVSGHPAISDAPTPVFQEIRTDDPAMRYSRRFCDYLMVKLTAHYAPRLSRKLTVLRQSSDPCLLRGLPTASGDGLLIALKAVPGTGEVRQHEYQSVEAIDPEVGRRDEILVPTAEVPEDMAALTMAGVTVGCVDDTRLFLFTDAPGIARAITSTWLDPLAAPPAYGTDDADSARQLARAALTPAGDDDRNIDMQRRGVANAERQIARIDTRIAACEAAIADAPPPRAPDQIMAQIEAACTDGAWTVGPFGADLILTPTFKTVTDPRDGSTRKAPGRFGFSLRETLAGRPPLQYNQADLPVNARHPRIMGSSFLSMEIEEAFRETVAGGDLKGALDLAHDVLTSFSSDDPDVAALDAWPLA